MAAASLASRLLLQNGVCARKRCTEQVNHRREIACTLGVGLSWPPSLVSSWPVLFAPQSPGWDTASLATTSHLGLIPPLRRGGGHILNTERSVVAASCALL